MSELVVRQARPNEAASVARAMAGAFETEPSVLAMLGSRADRRERLIELLELQLRTEYLHSGIVDLALDGDQIVGAALWSAPDAGAGSTLAQLRLVPRYLRILGRDFWRAAWLEIVSLRHHPGFPHWYLYMLGVAPGQQGRGIGGQLLQHRLDRLPADQSAYLEASTPGSARLYARFGFVPLGPVPLTKGATMTGMWRPATNSMT